jgi:hypothetical protein
MLQQSSPEFISYGEGCKTITTGIPNSSTPTNAKVPLAGAQVIVSGEVAAFEIGPDESGYLALKRVL